VISSVTFRGEIEDVFPKKYTAKLIKRMIARPDEKIILL